MFRPPATAEDTTRDTAVLPSLSVISAFAIRDLFNNAVQALSLTKPKFLFIDPEDNYEASNIPFCRTPLLIGGLISSCDFLRELKMLANAMGRPALGYFYPTDLQDHGQPGFRNSAAKLFGRHRRELERAADKFAIELERVTCLLPELELITVGNGSRVLEKAKANSILSPEAKTLLTESPMFVLDKIANRASDCRGFGELNRYEEFLFSRLFDFLPPDSTRFQKAANNLIVWVAVGSISDKLANKFFTIFTNSEDGNLIARKLIDSSEDGCIKKYCLPDYTTLKQKALHTVDAHPTRISAIMAAIARPSFEASEVRLLVDVPNKFPSKRIWWASASRDATQEALKIELQKTVRGEGNKPFEVRIPENLYAVYVACKVGVVFDKETKDGILGNLHDYLCALTPFTINVDQALFACDLFLDLNNVGAGDEHLSLVREKAAIILDIQLSTLESEDGRAPFDRLGHLLSLILRTDAPELLRKLFETVDCSQVASLAFDSLVQESVDNVLKLTPQSPRDNFVAVHTELTRIQKAAKNLMPLMDPKNFGKKIDQKCRTQITDVEAYKAVIKELRSISFS